MTPEKHEALRLQVKDLVHAEMHLLEGFFTKRVMLMLEYADEITMPAPAAVELDDATVFRALEAAEPTANWRKPEPHCFPSLEYKMAQYRRALEAVWPKQPNDMVSGGGTPSA